MIVIANRYLGCVEAGGVSYENINMDQINSLCSEGFAKVEKVVAISSEY